MNRYQLILAAIAATVVAGCATTPPQTVAADSPDDKSYVTGSRLPVRDNSTTANVKGVTNKNAIDDMLGRGSSIYIPPKGGAN
ncbi:MAG TPA: hypothetical protein VHZ01_06035 [Casimicrobiaceae bacterium]|jgi:hypothetical protein|nr:hypothetical protein [Casimicrobiaceae bacterium]